MLTKNVRHLHFLTMQIESYGDGSSAITRRRSGLQAACLILNAVFCTAQIVFWALGINPYDDLSIPMAPTVSLFLICASTLVFLRGRRGARSPFSALSVAACLLIAYVGFLLLAPKHLADSVDIGLDVHVSQRPPIPKHHARKTVSALGRRYRSRHRLRSRSPS